MLTEADTCTRLILPKLQAAGWDQEPHSFGEQQTFTDGRIMLAGTKVTRKQKKRADYILRFRPDFAIAVVEAKPEDRPAGEGLQQAKEYAEILGLKFAYSTNGHHVVEFDYLTGEERELDAFPTPDELWHRFLSQSTLTEEQQRTLLEPYNHQGGKSPRYYQQIAINRAVQCVLEGQKLILLTMATGTGKTVVAFNIAWKLWQSRWNRTGEYRKPRILFLADRNVLVDEPMAKTFSAFGDARFKIENGTINKGREMYFAIYQALAKDANRPGLFKDYPPDFFDLIVIDECHRGSANDEGSWREILEYFEPAFQIGITATPKRADNVDTYRYFGDSIYTYSLRQGIEDGFLAPYRVHRIITSLDAAGWRPSAGDIDRYGRAIPDGEYQTGDFERLISLRKRTEAIAKHLADFMRKSDRFAKTIVFCVDQEHADDMRRALANLNSDLVKKFPDFVARVTSDEGDIGKGHLSNFQELERQTPVILTTSQLLTTGVDAPTCKNIVLARIVNSMTEFKQIIGRGTRVREDAGKLWFSILDYTGSATRLFADPEFDGDPASEDTTGMDEDGNDVPADDEDGEDTPTDEPDGEDVTTPGGDPQPGDRRKYYFDGGAVEIVQHYVSELDADGKQLRVVKFTEYAKEKIRTLYPSASDLRGKWSDPQQRKLIVEQLEERGITFEELAAASHSTDADPFDLLCYLAFNAPLKTRRERADRVRKQKADLFDKYGPKAREILQHLVAQYEQHGPAQLAIPDILMLPPINGFGNPMEIAALFGGAEQMRSAVNDLQAGIYAG